MTIAEILLEDFDAEMKNTRTTLERTPEVPADFKPHDKSMPCGRLSVHVATLPRFASAMLTSDSMDLAKTEWPKLVFESREQLLATFEELSTKLRSELASATDEYLSANWKMTWGDKVIANHPRSLLYRTMFLNHMIHHRAQLGVYLRLNNQPVPPLYGPSADDSMGF